MPVFVGTSGWMYSDWRGRFYPGEIPQRRWLEYYAERFDTVELNNAFYRLPSYDDFAAWRQRLPSGFTVAVKASRYLTHIKRLRDPDEPVTRLVEHAAGLEDRLGPLLLQLPPNLEVSVARLDACLAAFPRTIRVAVEPRHASWWIDEVREVLERHGAALCWADRRSEAQTPTWRTADWGYLRFHEGLTTPWPRYGEESLRTWADRVGETFGRNADVYAYFNNDPGAAAVGNAEEFAAICSTYLD